MGSVERSPMLVGHPLTALERELKRLVVREELEKDQHQIIENGLSPREVKERLLKLYELYETFKNEDNSCLSDTDTKYNMYKLYRDVFKSKKAGVSETPAQNTARLKEKPRATTALPLRTGGAWGGTIQRLNHRPQACASATLSVPPTFPHNGRSPPPKPTNIPTTPRRTLGVPSNKPIKQSTGSSTCRPRSAPADFEYNKLYTANRCHTTRRTLSCHPCRANCTCVLCSPLQESPNPCWRDITCPVTPDKSQIEAHWEEMSPLIQSKIQMQKLDPPPRKKAPKNKKSKDKTTLPDDIPSSGSKDEIQSVRSRPEQVPKPNRRDVPHQAWAAKPLKQSAPLQPVKKTKSQRKSSKIPSPTKQKVPRQQRPNVYQRHRRSEKRYKWDKESSESDSDDGIDNSDMFIGIDRIPSVEDALYRGRILRERKRHKWGDYSAVLTARALYLYDREYDQCPKEILPLWGTKLSINADKTDLQYSFILKTPSTNKNKAMYKMSALTEDEMRLWLMKLKEAMKLNIDITAEIARNNTPSVFGELPEHSAWSHEGYRIDVSYINDNILVCSFPPTRSDVYELKRFVDDKHKGHYRIVNVCEEKSYDTAMFKDTVFTYPTPHNGVCKLSDLWKFCEFADKWFKESDGNVILLHCRTGTVRSGLLVCAYLIHSRICWTSEQAIKMFKTKRQNGLISLPCQKRYLKYIETSILAGEKPEDIQLLLSAIHLATSPAFNEDGSCKPYFVIYQRGEEIYEYESEKSYKSEDDINFGLSLPVSGDIKILFYSVSDILGTQEMFTIHFHTFYINSSNIRFTREMIDGAHLNTFKQFTEHFSVSLEFR